MSEISFTEVICQTGKKTAVITLTRTSALNALSFDMLQQMQLWLHAWQQDDAIQGVIIHSETLAAFCAGGDLKARVAGAFDRPQAAHVGDNPGKHILT